MTLLNIIIFHQSLSARTMAAGIENKIYCLLSNQSFLEVSKTSLGFPDFMAKVVIIPSENHALSIRFQVRGLWSFLKSVLFLLNHHDN